MDYQELTAAEKRAAQAMLKAYNNMPIGAAQEFMRLIKEDEEKQLRRLISIVSRGSLLGANNG